MTTAAPRQAEPRVPRHSRTSERGLIGACLLSRTMIDATVDMVNVEDFYVPIHSHIWQTIVETHQAGEAVDATTIAARYHGPGSDEILLTLGAILADTASTYSATTHAASIKEWALHRRAVALAGELAELGYSDTPMNDIAVWALKALQELDRSRGGNGPIRAIDALEEWARRERAIIDGDPEPLGIPTGFVDLDERLLGLHRGQLITVAARPSMGKTALVLQWAINAVAEGHTVLFVSAEMSVAEITQRMIATGSKVDMHRVRSHKYLHADWPQIDHAIDRYRQGGMLWIDDDSSSSVATIRSHARKIANLDLIVVDYLQLLTPAQKTRETRQTEVGEIATGLKRLARELNVPVVAAAQLNRNLESRSDKRPMLSDLRESGQIEADSDVVIGLYRDEVYDPQSNDRGTAEFIILKHRNGATGVAHAAYLAHYVRFENMARM